MYEVQAMDQMMTMIEESVQMLVDMLGQYRMMYHQCVSLLTYQEDLHYFWQRLNKTYTPLHQIQYLVEDAQSPPDET